MDRFYYPTFQILKDCSYCGEACTCESPNPFLLYYAEVRFIEYGLSTEEIAKLRASGMLRDTFFEKRQDLVKNKQQNILGISRTTVLKKNYTMDFKVAVNASSGDALVIYNYFEEIGYIDKWTDIAFLDTLKLLDTAPRNEGIGTKLLQSIEEHIFDIANVDVLLVCANDTINEGTCLNTQVTPELHAFYTKNAYTYAGKKYYFKENPNRNK